MLLRRYKRCGSHHSRLWHNSCKGMYVWYMSPNKNRKVIFTTCYGKIDQFWQVPSTELPQNIESPCFCSSHWNFRKNFPHPGSPPLTKGKGGYMNTTISLAYMKQSHVLFLEPWKSNFSNPGQLRNPVNHLRWSIFQK